MELTGTNTFENLMKTTTTNKANDTFSVERLKTRTKGDKRNYKFFKNNLSKIKNGKMPSNFNSINKVYFNTISNGEQIQTNLKEFKMFRCESFPKKEHNFFSEKMPYIPDKERKKSEDNFIYLIKELIKSKQLQYSQNSTKALSDKNINLFNDLNNFCKKSRKDPFKPKGYNFYEFSRKNPSLSNDETINYSTVLQRVKDYDNDKNLPNLVLDKFINKGHVKNCNKLLKFSKCNSLSDFENNEKTNNNTKIINTDNYSNKMRDINFSNNNRYLNTVQDSNFHNQIYNNKISHFNTLEPTESLSNNYRTSILQKIFNDKNRIFNGIYKLNLKNNEYSKSDVFNSNKEYDSQTKKSEKYLYKKNSFKINNNLLFPKKTDINEVGWSPKDKTKTRSRISCSSVAFNILSPSLRNFSPTKKEIDKLNNYNFFKTPLISEFKNITKPGISDLRKEYLKQLDNDKNSFHKKIFVFNTKY